MTFKIADAELYGQEPHLTGKGYLKSKIEASFHGYTEVSHHFCADGLKIVKYEDCFYSDSQYFCYELYTVKQDPNI
jgi:hypothetical protein